MKPERIEEIARLVYETENAHTQWDQPPPWALLNWNKQALCRRVARTLYAAAMRDAAGVARAQAEHDRIAQGNIYQPLGEQLIHRTVVKTADGIALTLETIAKETDRAGN